MVTDLKDTVEGMLSSDYKERFVAEYDQLKFRIVKLDQMLYRWEKGELDFTPTCSKELLQLQVTTMKSLLQILDLRAIKENIPVKE